MKPFFFINKLRVEINPEIFVNYVLNGKFYGFSVGKREMTLSAR